MKGPPRLWRREVLCRVVGVRPDLILRLEKAGLIARRGVGTGRATLYDDDAKARIARVKELLNAGYAERDIAHILGRVESTRGARPIRFLGADELAPAPRDGRAEADAAIAAGIGEPDAVRDDGMPLIAADSTTRWCCALDLVLLGLPDAAREVAAGGRPEGLDDLLAARRQAAMRAARTVALIAPMPRRARWRGRPR